MFETVHNHICTCNCLLCKSFLGRTSQALSNLALYQVLWLWMLCIILHIRCWLSQKSFDVLKLPLVLNSLGWLHYYLVSIVPTNHTRLICWRQSILSSSSEQNQISNSNMSVFSMISCISILLCLLFLHCIVIPYLLQ